MTAEAIGADQVWAGAVAGDARLHRPRHRRGDHRHRRRRAASAPAQPRRAQPGLHRRRGSAPPNGDENGHGTHIAGIIRDVAPGAHIVSLQAMGADGSGLTSNVIEAHRLGDRQPARVEHQDRQRVARAPGDGVGEGRSAVPGRAARDRRRASW